MIIHIYIYVCMYDMICHIYICIYMYVCDMICHIYVYDLSYIYVSLFIYTCYMFISTSPYRGLFSNHGLWIQSEVKDRLCRALHPNMLRMDGC